MAQPKDPPLSVRLPKPLRERVEAWATERSIKRNAAVVQLIERGLMASGPGLPSPERQAEMKRAVAAKQKGAADAPSVAVPFAGNLTRKPMQKKGK